MSDANSCFENLERNLKKISIVLIDDFEEIKKGTPGPVISLIRKLLFNTSTVMMKSMLLRGVASHVPDKKLIIATFDLLRETVKYSPQITIDQFFSTGFSLHKLTILSKLAEYVGHVDRSIVRTPTKTTIVVPNEAVLKLQNQHSLSMAGSSHFELEEYTTNNGQSLESAMHSHDWPLTDFLKSHLHSEKPKPKTSVSTVGSAKKDSPTKRSTSAPRLRTTPKAEDNRKAQLQQDKITSPKIYRASEHPELKSVKKEVTYVASEVDDTQKAKDNQNNHKNNENQAVEEENKDSIDLGDSDRLVSHANNNEASPRFGVKKTVSVEDFLNTSSTDGLINYESLVKNPIFQEKINQFIEQRVEEILKDKTDAIVKDVSEKYDFVINKLVAAVDAEFTLLNNRMKILEAQVKN